MELGVNNWSCVISKKNMSDILTQNFRGPMYRIVCVIVILALLGFPTSAQRSGRSSRPGTSSSTRSSSSSRVVQVRGYTRKDGTYVPPHNRTAPNSTKLDNWSTKGNVNPYTGEPGTVDPYPENNRSGVKAVSSVAVSSDAILLLNRDVINMLRVGLSSEDLKRIIAEGQTSFDTSPPALVELKRAGVPDEVVKAMIGTPQSVSTTEALPALKNKNFEGLSALNLSSPEVRGFQLGMSMDKVLSRFERDLHVADKGFGLTTVETYPFIYALHPADFKGIRRLYFEFTDQVLTQVLTKMTIGYDSSVRWTSSEEFYKAVCNGLGVQYFAASIKRSGGPYEHDYSDFFVGLEYNYGIVPELHLITVGASEIVAKRRSDDELRKRQTFRP
jgi:hypothetical protein